MRPLFYYSFGDSSAYRAEDEYFWGENMLVAPVTSAGVTARMLYLPKGKWYNLATNVITEGNQWVNTNVDLKNIPVFVKEGSFIATNTTPVRNTTAYNTGNLTITYFPSKDSSNYFL